MGVGDMKRMIQRDTAMGTDHHNLIRMQSGSDSSRRGFPRTSMGRYILGEGDLLNPGSVNHRLYRSAKQSRAYVEALAGLIVTAVMLMAMSTSIVRKK